MKPFTEEESLPPGVNPKVAAVYSQVGQLLSRYKSGKLPKAFKIIPSLANWEDILYLTEPDKWTPHAVFQATRIFVSNLKPKQSQRFFSLVLLDRVRDDIQDHKKLNYHLYMSLKKALYKASAFFKGILFPLCEVSGFFFDLEREGVCMYVQPMHITYHAHFLYISSFLSPPFHSPGRVH